MVFWFATFGGTDNGRDLEGCDVCGVALDVCRCCCNLEVGVAVIECAARFAL